MSKYVIKNCPACVISPSVCSEWHTKHGGKAKDCSDITDCVMKRIVEKCREAQEIMDKEQYYEDDFDTFNGESIMAETIMDMLEIEECE